MEYSYSEKYGSHDVHKTKYGSKRSSEYDMYGQWYKQDAIDATVDKALLQCYKEDKLPFTKLLAKLQAETVRAMHSGEKDRKTAYAVLETYSGRVTLHGDRLMKLPAGGYHGSERTEHIGSLADYWRYLLATDIAAQHTAHNSTL